MRNYESVEDRDRPDLKRASNPPIAWVERVRTYHGSLDSDVPTFSQS